MALICKGDARQDESFFLVAYDKRRRLPLWTAYRLTAADMEAAAQSGITRRSHGSDFQSDSRLHRSARGKAPLAGEDFKGAGLDRGHLAPAAALAYDAEAYTASFTVANLALQNAELNRGAWRHLEARVRAWARARGVVYVITGVILGRRHSLFIPLDKPEVRIVVPEAFYKLIYDPLRGQAIAFLYANAPPAGTKLADATLSVDQLEDRAGLDFFPLMPAASGTALESRSPDLAAWGLGPS